MKKQQEKEKGLFIQDTILLSPDLNANEKIIFAYIKCFKTFFMQQNNLAANLSIPLRTVKRTIATLIEKGYLKYDNGKNKYNRKALKIAKNPTISNVTFEDPRYSNLAANFISEDELDSVEF